MHAAIILSFFHHKEEKNAEYTHLFFNPFNILTKNHQEFSLLKSNSFFCTTYISVI